MEKDLVAPLLLAVEGEEEGEQEKSLSNELLEGTNKIVPQDIHLNNESSKFPWREVLMLSLIGFLLNCMPSEPFLTKYLKRDKHITEEQLDNIVWPADTYSSLVFFLPAGLLAEVIGYRYVIMGGLFLREMTRIVLIFGEGVSWMAFMQVTYAASYSVNTIYFSYLYLIVSPLHYEKATAYVHAAYHLGNVLGSGLGQILVSYSSVGNHLKDLFYVSWGFTTLSLLAFLLCFPKPKYPAPDSLVSIFRSSGLKEGLLEIKALYNGHLVLALSLWWVLGGCAYNILVNYYQTQFSDLDPDGAFGVVELLIEFFDLLGSLGPAMMAAALTLVIYPITICSSALIGTFFYVSTVYQSSVYYSYVFNIAWMCLYSFQLACSMSTLAKKIPSSRYAVFFSFNTLISFALAAILQAVATQYSFSTNSYFVMGSLLQVVLVASVILIYILTTWTTSCCSSYGKKQYVALNIPPNRENSNNKNNILKITEGSAIL